jgi:hypothetical protein
MPAVLIIEIPKGGRSKLIPQACLLAVFPEADICLQVLVNVKKEENECGVGGECQWVGVSKQNEERARHKIAKTHRC